jgi:peroxiredoxin
VSVQLSSGLTPVCGDQMTLYNQVLPEFQRFNAELLGISVDGVWSHLAFSKDRNLHFPLLSDFEPKGAKCAPKNTVYILNKTVWPKEPYL